MIRTILAATAALWCSAAMACDAKICLAELVPGWMAADYVQVLSEYQDGGVIKGLGPSSVQPLYVPIPDAPVTVDQTLGLVPHCLILYREGHLTMTGCRDVNPRVMIDGDMLTVEIGK